MKDKRKFTFRTIIIAFLFGSFVALGSVYLYFVPIKSMLLITEDDMTTIEDVLDRVGKYYEIDREIGGSYLYDLDEEEFEDNVAKEMIELIDDDYAYYYTKEEYTNWKDSLKSSYSGIGITYTKIDGQYIVIELYPNGPAENAGMEVGDVIRYVDGESYDDINLMSDNIMGKVGTEVTITIDRDEDTFDLDIIRTKIDNKTVKYEILEEDIGYIDISSFGMDTADEFEKALLEFRNNSVKKMIIDLRNNPGGLVSTCLEITDSLLPECKMLITRNKDENEEIYNSDVSTTDMEYVILVNENSASASEIMSVAIKDNEGGTIIGTQTFGKGVMQENVELSDGSAIKLTTMEYFSPDGNIINKIGVTPDVIIKNDDNLENDEQMDKAIEILAK